MHFYNRHLFANWQGISNPAKCKKKATFTIGYTLYNINSKLKIPLMGKKPGIKSYGITN